MIKIAAIAAASLILAACDRSPPLSSAELAARYCSPDGSQAAFDFVQNELRKKNNFWKLSIYHSSIQRHRGGCKHEVAGYAERKSVGMTRRFIAEATYNQETRSWQIDQMEEF